MKKHTVESVIFDLDGVITKTALVHALAWKVAFDEYLRLREARDKEPFREFTHEGDYLPYVDGKPRYEGVKSFLESRNIHIPYGTPDDDPDQETVCGIGNRKNVKFVEVLDKEGVEVYESTIKLVKELKANGIKVGVASSSKNCQRILQAAKIEDLFETRVDGVVSAQLGLNGKPEGDIFVRAALNLGCRPLASVVVEDAVSGVAAGRNGGFKLVLGVARENNEEDLLKHGADVVVRDLAFIDLKWIDQWFARKPRGLLEAWDKQQEGQDKDRLINPTYLSSAKDAFLNGKKVVFFLDYDGTLTPIVDRPDLAVLSTEMRSTIAELSKKYTTAIVSGRMRTDVENLVNIKGLFYAGSHGFDIVGPGFKLIQSEAQETIPLVSEVIKRFHEQLGNIEGLLVEEKKFSVAVHYRLVDEKKHFDQIKKCVEETVKAHSELRLMHGKKVFEILPAMDWDKGKAVRWIMKAFNLDWDEVTAVYIGDDTTDEDAFRMVATRGVGVLVAAEPKPSSATYQLNSPDDVKAFFKRMIEQS